MREIWVPAAVLLAAVGTARAADLGVAGAKLVVKDTVAVNGKATLELVLRKQANVHKGADGSTDNLEASLEVFYSDEPGNLSKVIVGEGTAWARNHDGKARYANNDAPNGGAIRSVTIEDGKTLKIKAKALGDDSYWKMDLGAGAPSATGGVTAIVTIRNGNDASVHRMCTRFATADGAEVKLGTTHEGLGHRLTAKNGVPVDCTRVAYFRMEPDLARGFFASPWPNDTRVLPDGSLDVTNFPIPAGNSIAEAILSGGAAVTHGFGPNAAVFFQSCAAVDASTLPSAENSVLAGSTAMLVNLDNPGEARIPVLVDIKDTQGILRPPDLLSLLPYPGHPLKAATRYAAILFDGILDPNGAAFAPAPLLAELDDPWDATKPVDATTWTALKAQRDDVYEYVTQHTTWAPQNVIAFTVYTTQDPTAELEAIAAAVDAMPQPTPLSRTTGNCSGGALRTTVSGQLRLPKWQAGTYPYLSAGGGIVVSSGVAVQQGTEDVSFGMTFPCGAAPANGWPILLFITGTGGGVNSANISYLGANAANPLPYVVGSIAPLYSGDRYVSGLPTPYDDSAFLYFNYLNPLAGRTNQIQQAADFLYLRRVMEGIVLSAAETGNASPVQTDDDIVAITGHSQGALTIPHVLAVDSSYHAAFVSAGGAGLYQTILHRDEVRQPLAAVLGPGVAELDMFHPLVHAVQTFAEGGDAANYAPLVTQTHILSTSGLIDGCSPVEAISILGTALGLEVTNALYYPVFGVGTLETPSTPLPVSGNLGGTRTGVTVQLDTGHFGSATNPNLARSFLDSAATGGTPTINPGMLSSDSVAGCDRYDPLP